MVVLVLLIHLLAAVASASDTDPRPVIVPNSRVAVSVVGNPALGYFLIGSVDSDSIGLIDNGGVLRFTRQTGPSVNLIPTPYGGLTYYHGTLGKYVLLDDRLRATDTFGVEPPFTTDFHEGYQTRGRRYFVLGTEERPVDMSTLVANGHYDAIVIGAVIQEFDRYGRKTFEWKSLDHISPLEATPDVDLTNKRIDYIHVNSIAEDNDRNILISCRNLDQVVKIDKATGAIIWRLGGSAAASSDFAIVNDDNSGFHGFSHQHTVMRARNGDILMFDNGNLRPIPFARAVAYKLDEQAKTATKTWEYISREMQVANTMGSVQELTNGNVLIGWGSTPTGLLASEVDRSGRLHAEIQSLSPIAIPYRVRKGVIAMTASTRVLDTIGRVVFAQIDSSTRISFDVTSIPSTQLATIEKHNYEPNNITFVGIDPPCHLFPVRWTVRFSDTTRVDGAMTFDLSRMLGDIDIEDVEIYHRAEENDGSFNLAASTSVPGTHSRVISSIQPGEYLIATRYCAQPVLRVPNNNSVVSASVMMEWTEALGADGYELEVSEDPAFGNETRMYRTLYNDTTLTGFSAGSTYHWRVRVIRQPEVGPWTLPWSFTTPLTSSVDETQTPRIRHTGTVLEITNHPHTSSVELCDVTGRIVLRTQHPQRVDISHLPHGVYMVVVTTTTNTHHRQVITR